MKRVAKYCGALAVAIATLLAITSTPASAAITYYASTTGAAGRATYLQNGVFDLYARDTLTDGHCAQWQSRWPGGAWSWTGSRACSSTETHVGLAEWGQDVRICRTGVGNCSSAIRLGS